MKIIKIPSLFLMGILVYPISAFGCGDKYGVVEYYNADRGYGSVLSEGASYFIHHTKTIGDKKRLEKGDMVSFSSEGLEVACIKKLNPDQ
jgi:cold shock CspA family protein